VDVKVVQAQFYKSPAGNEPVKEWLRALSKDDKKAIGGDISTVEWKWPLGFPLVTKLDTDLWEVRSKITDGIARVFFTICEKQMVLLHGIIKKSKKTPKEDLDLAKKRRNEVLEGGMNDGK
jgi:phage-related protein